jgi:hypothetical protein
MSKGQGGALILGLIVIAVFLFSVSSGLGNSGYDMSTDLNKLPDEAKAAINFFNPGLALTIGLGLIAAISAVFFGIVGIFKFPKSSMKAIITIAVLLVIFFVFYSMSGTEFGLESKMSKLIQKNELSDGVVKFIGGGINVTILLACLSLALMVIFEIKNAFN